MTIVLLFIWLSGFAGGAATCLLLSCCRAAAKQQAIRRMDNTERDELTFHENHQAR